MSTNFLTGDQWGVLIAVFLFVVPNWGSLKTWFASLLELAEYTAALIRIQEQRSLGGFIIRNGWALLILTIFRNLLLWIAFVFYILPGATPGFETDYIVINSLVFAGTVFVVVAENGFWTLASFGWALGFRIFAWLIFIAAAIVVGIETASKPSGDVTWYGWLLLAALIVVFLFDLLIYIPRYYVFWADKSDNPSGYTLLNDEEEMVVPTVGKPAANLAGGAANQRAVNAALAAQQNAWRK
jgi:hypothetical protein